MGRGRIVRDAWHSRQDRRGEKGLAEEAIVPERSHVAPDWRMGVAIFGGVWRAQWAPHAPSGKKKRASLLRKAEALSDSRRLRKVRYQGEVESDFGASDSGYSECRRHAGGVSGVLRA